MSTKSFSGGQKAKKYRRNGKYEFGFCKYC